MVANYKAFGRRAQSRYLNIYIYGHMALSHLLPCPECALWSQIMPTAPHRADMSAVRHSRHFCCMTQQTCPRRLLPHTTDMLLRDTADMAAA